MAVKLWSREKKERTQTRYLKQGDIFSFFYDNQYYFWGRIIAVKPQKYCIVELFDYVSESPEIDEQTIVSAKRLIPPFNVDDKYVFQDKLMKWDWRIIGHQEEFTAPDQDAIFMVHKDKDQEFIKEDLNGNIIKISEEEAANGLRVLFHDPQVKVIREVLLRKILNETPKPDPSSTTEEDLFKYADPLFDSKKYAEVISSISAFPEDKITRRLAGLLICALNNTGEYDGALECLEKFKFLFSEDMYRWYYFSGYALMQKKEYEKILPIIEEGLKACERAHEDGIITEREYGTEKGHFNYFSYERKKKLEEQESCKFVNGFVIENGKLIRYEGDTNITELVIPEGVKEVSMSSFNKNKNIRSFIIPEGVEKISYFTGLSNLEKIVFPSTLQSLWQDSLEDTLWYQKQPKGQIICGKVLYKYTGEEVEVTVEDGVENITAYAFRGHKELRKVVIPNSVKIIWAGVFKDCTNLSEVILPDGLEFVSSGTFENCVSLREITLPDGMTRFGNDVFNGCVNLREVVLPDTIVEMCGGVFDGCKNLERVHLPAKAVGSNFGVDEWEPHIDGRLFKGCEKLTEVTIPQGISKITEETFAGCTSIQKIVVDNPDMMFGKDTFGKKAKYPEVLYETSPELPLHLTDGDIKQYIDLDRLSDEMKALLYIKRQSKSLAPFWEKSITKGNVKAIANKIDELSKTKLSSKEKKNAKQFFEKYSSWL